MEVPAVPPSGARPHPAHANIGGFDTGGPNPATSFNPNGGQDDQGTHNFTGSDPNQSLSGTSPSAGPTPQNTEYSRWTWEQILNEVLGLNVPDRSLITNGRWTGVELNESADAGLFPIFEITWYDNRYRKKTTSVYLAPEFTAESTSASPPTQSPWLVYERGPGQILSALAPGAFGLDVPGNSDLQLDPSGFTPAALDLMNVENFYLNAEDNLQFVAHNLAGNATQFQGEAGGAFAQLIQDFSQQATYASLKMGLSSGITPGQSQSYSGLVLQAGQSAGTFLSTLYNGWTAWTGQLTHSPLGSILQAMIDVGIVTGSPGAWGVNKNINLLNTPVGDLTQDAAWQAIETRAKTYWLKEVVGGLDTIGQAGLGDLISQYEQTTDRLIPLKAPTPTQIGAGIGTTPNSSSLFPNNLFDGLFPNNMFSGIFPNNMFSGLFPNNLFADMSPNNSLGGLPENNVLGGLSPNNVLADMSPNNPLDVTGAPSGALMSTGPVPNQPVPESVNSPPSALTAVPSALVPGAATQPAAGLLAVPNQTPAAGSLPAGTSGANPLSAVQQALDSNAGTQDALQSALTSGQVTPGSALQGDLNTALNDANQTQAALNQAAGAGGTTTSALQTALGDNAATQAALNQALNSGQVTPGSPLATSLQSAQNSANQTQAALNQALAAGPPPSAAQTAAAQTALGDNSQTQHELSQALLSGQVPASSPLHSTIQSALTDAGKTQAAINQALTSGTGGTTASLDQALKDNTATQKALESALASGQVPASGPLRTDLNQALADTRQTGTALQQALAQQGVLSEPNVGALSSPVGVAGLGAAGAGLGSTPLLSATVPATGTTAQAGPISSGAFAPAAAQTATAAGESPFPMYSPMAGGGMMGGQGMGQGQGQERERSTWLAEDEDVWGTDPDVGPQVLGRDFIDDEEPEEYDGHTERRPVRPDRKRPIPRAPGR